MVPLSKRRRKSAAWVATALLVAGGAMAFSQSLPETGESPEVAADVDRLAEAERAYLSAEFERARDVASEEIERLDALPADARPEGELARAYAILVQALYNLGQTARLEESIDSLIRVSPGYELDPDTAGPKLVERIEARRRALVGRLRVQCEPLPCEELLLDGRPVPPDAEGLLSALAGARRLTARHHNFVDHEIEAVDVVAGKTIDVVVEMIQRARDVRLATTPGGVEVYLDGVLVGATGPGDSGEPESLELREVTPGSHVLELRRECFRRLEQRFEVVLDRLDPSPMDLGVIELARARGIADLTWDRAEGVLTLDGSPVTPGRHELCPGEHEASLSLAGRRVWFETFDLIDGSTVSLAPTPRPTIAVVDLDDAPDAEVLAFAGEDWNRVRLGRGPQAETARALIRQMKDAWSASTVPAFPERAVEEAPDVTAAAGRLAPEADLVATWIETESAIRPVTALLLASPGTGLVETTAWPAGDDAAPRDAGRVLGRPASLATPFVGFDAADRMTGAPVVAAVHRTGPAAKAGLVPGMVVLGVDGSPLLSATALRRIVSEATLPGRLTMEMHDGSETKDISVAIAPNLRVSTPAYWRGRFLLPSLAHAELDRLAGAGAARLHGSLTIGMILASLGRAEDAALALDRASIDEAMDPSGDARGTVLFVLERLFRELGNLEYAGEIAARWRRLDDARFGGRDGAPLRHARPAAQD